MSLKSSNPAQKETLQGNLETRKPVFGFGKLSFETLIKCRNIKVVWDVFKNEKYNAKNKTNASLSKTLQKLVASSNIMLRKILESTYGKTSFSSRDESELLGHFEIVDQSELLSKE